MTRLLIIVVPLILAFWVFSIVDCALQPPIRHRGVPKVVWMLIVLLIPVLGGVLWFVVGRVPAARLAVSSAPDDDPAFLGTLHSMSAQDERIRQLEEELAKLDAEDAPSPDPFEAPADKPRADKPKPDTRSDKPRRSGDETSTPTPPAGDVPPHDGDDDGRGRHGTSD